MINTFLGPIAKYLPENNTLERIWVLAKLDFRSRYYYHKLGIIWALIRPIFELIVYYTIFKTIFKTDIEYFELYIFSGLLLWYFFVEGTSKGINVLLTKRYLIESISFRKSDLLAATTLSALMAFLFNCGAYFAISIFRGNFDFNIGLLLFPLVVLNMLLVVYGVGLIIATCSIYFKDIQHIWDMIVLAGFWITPIVYSEEILLKELPIVVYVNPVAGIIVNMHKTLLYGEALNLDLFFYTFGVGIFLVWCGLHLFSRYSHKAAEKY